MINHHWSFWDIWTKIWLKSLNSRLTSWIYIDINGIILTIISKIYRRFHMWTHHSLTYKYDQGRKSTDTFFAMFLTHSIYIIYIDYIMTVRNSDTLLYIYLFNMNLGIYKSYYRNWKMSDLSLSLDIDPY